MHTPTNRTEWRVPHVLSHQQNQVEVIICALPLTEPSGGHLMYPHTYLIKVFDLILS